MPTITTSRGYGSRLIGSIKGIGIGFLLFIVSFGVLFWNEGRVDLSKVAEDAIAVSSEASADRSQAQGKLISTVGALTSDEKISDGVFLNPGPYLKVTRKVEMYAWKEETSEVTKTKLGGSTETETTYDYVKEWTSSPQNSNNFKFPADHTNPQIQYKNETEVVNSAKLGGLTINANGLDLPAASPLALSNELLNLPENTELIGTDYVFIPTQIALNDLVEDKEFDEDETFVSSFNNPTVGDTRISYRVLSSGTEGTLFGLLDGDKISTFRDKNDNIIFRFFLTDAGGALDTLHKEYKTALWLFRLLGFLMMWIGLAMILGPLSVLLDVIPFLGSLSRSAVKMITFLVALVLSFITIVISAILHSIMALLVIIILAGGVAAYFIIQARAKSQLKQVQSNQDQM